MPLSSILEKIMADARLEAEAVEAGGRLEADGILASAVKEAAALQHRLLTEAEEKIRARREQEISARRLKLARDLLAVRRECLEAVFAGLQERLIPDSADEYAALLIALAGEDVMAGRAVLQVGRRDTERFGKNFAATVLKSFTSAFPGRDAVLSAAPAAFTHGLVVRQPEFVRNLSLEDLVAEGREEMEGEVAKTLFAT
jgi:vacuolar-type H+-ATPase subunit E/Vma4